MTIYILYIQLDEIANVKSVFLDSMYVYLSIIKTAFGFINYYRSNYY